MLKKSPVANYQSLITKRGFTLIELLVVISIIGILAGLTLSSYSGAQKQARDSQRRSDLNQYRNALEVYAGANNLKYPGYNNEVQSTTLCRQLSAVMSSCPADPLTTQYYYYRSDGVDNTGDATATQYILWATLETGGCWEVCSNGKTGKVPTPPTSSGCTLP
jgi:prepilin-type N-terminal cleavage/methylation domain-containing protein